MTVPPRGGGEPCTLGGGGGGAGQGGGGEVGKSVTVDTQVLPPAVSSLGTPLTRVEPQGPREGRCIALDPLSMRM